MATPGAFNLNTLTGGALNPLYTAPKPTTAAAPAPKPAAAPSGSGAWWYGADGNVYLKGAGGNGASVTNLGLAGNVKTNQLGGAVQINDPNPPRQSAPTTSGSGSGTTYADKSNDITQQNAGLNAVDTQINSGVGAVDKALGLLNGTYDTEAAAAKSSYDTNTGQNKVNLTKNQQTALVNASQGRQGLSGTLASLGALNGSGIDLLNRAVQKGANEDLAGASDNYATNANALDTAYGTFTAQDKQRRDEARAAAETAKTKVKNTGLQSRLGYYQNLSNDYAAQGDKGNASKYADLASSLFPEIASTSVPDVTPTYSAAAFTAPALSSYLNGGNTQVNVSSPNAATGGIPGLSASTVRRKVTA